MKKVIINLVTHSAYKDVCENFLNLFDKNWHDCKFEFCISVIGDKIDFRGKKVIYNGNKCTLPEAIYNLMNNSDYDYCLSFLGDAFINTKVNNDEINKIIEEIDKCNIEYCNLIPKAAYRHHKISLNRDMRFITTNDNYNMSFVAFIASKKFILQEFKDKISDLDFEKKYLNRENVKYQIYKNRTILNKNVLGIVPGISAGKWDRHALNKLQKDNPEIEFTNRPKMSVKEMIENDIIQILQTWISCKQRMVLKKMISRITGKKFVTQF